MGSSLSRVFRFGIAPAMLGIFIIFVTSVGFAFAAAGITNIDVNGADSTTVLSEGDVVISVTVTLTDGTDWRGTAYRFESGNYFCVNTPNHESNGTYTETFTVDAPDEDGVYDVDIRTYNDSDCDDNNGIIDSDDNDHNDSESLNNSVTVVEKIITSATVDGGSTTTVNPSDTVASEVDVTIAGDGNNNDWESTRWRISTDPSSGGTTACVNHSDHELPGNYDESFNMTAPGTAGTYNAYFTAYENDSCGGDASQTYALSNGVVVENPNGTIVVDKVTDPSGSEQIFSFDAAGGVYADFTLTDAQTPNSQSLVAGNYSVSEEGADGWVQNGAVCVSSIGDAETVGAIELDAGEIVTCTFSNSKLGKITVIKQTLPDGDDQEFAFSMNDGEATSTFTLADGDSWESDFLAVGQYTVTETSAAGFDLTDLVCNDDNGVVDLSEGTAILNVGVGEEITCTYTNTKRASFSMTKYTDPAIGTYQFGLDDVSLEQDGVPASSTEMTQGEWSLDDLLPGSYLFSETIIDLPDTDPIWARNVSCDGNYSDPTSGSIESPFGLTMLPGESMSCVVNNTQNAVITGKKFEDMDGHGEEATGPVLSGWTISISGVGETVYATTTDVTDASGDYSFLVAPGTYRVCEQGQEDWYQSYPTNEVGCDDGMEGYEITVGAGEVSTGNDFGNYQNGTVVGLKWNDENANGVLDEGEEGLSEWTIQLQGSSCPDSVTTSGGAFSFEAVAPGTYTLSEVMQEGWAQTYPAGAGTHTITVQSGGHVIRNFGNVEDSVISGQKWNDVNGDGIWDEGETAPIASFTFSLYKQDGDSWTGPVATDSGTSYSFAGLLPGTYKVTEGDTAGWVQTYPTAAGSHVVTVGINDESAGNNFGNIETFTLEGYKYNDLNHDGYWDGEEGDSESADEPGLSGWTIVATPIEWTTCDEESEESCEEPTLVEDTNRTAKTTVTDEEGEYNFEFRAKETGLWKISEVQQDGWSQTAPEGMYYLITVTTTGIDHDYHLYEGLFLFGNWQWPVVELSKWNDVNSDGVKDESEAPVANYPVAIGRKMPLPEEGQQNIVPIEIIALSLTGSNGVASIPLDPSWFEGGINELENAIDQGFFAFEGQQSNWAKTFPNFSHNDTINLTWRAGLTPIPMLTDSFFDVFTEVAPGQPMTTGKQHDTYSPIIPLHFGNHFTAPVSETPSAPIPPSGGGGNGPIAGSFGNVAGGGLVLGTSTSTISMASSTISNASSSCAALLTSYMRRGMRNDPAQVRLLQTFLTDHGYTIPATGFFGVLTEAAVKRLQYDHATEVLAPWGITDPTGYVYKMTLHLINKMACPTLNVPVPKI